MKNGKECNDHILLAMNSNDCLVGSGVSSWLVHLPVLSERHPLSLLERKQSMWLMCIQSQTVFVLILALV